MRQTALHLFTQHNLVQLLKHLEYRHKRRKNSNQRKAAQNPKQDPYLLFQPAPAPKPAPKKASR